MLTQLYIKNFALIDELDIPFEPGFSVITGETGAGKSIILGALGLVMGQRADVKAIKHGTEKCTVEAHFNIEAYVTTSTTTPPTASSAAKSTPRARAAPSSTTCP